MAGLGLRAALVLLLIGSFGASAAHALTDVRLFFQGFLVAQDPNPTNPSNVVDTFGGIGVFGAYSDLSGPLGYAGSTYIQLDTATSDPITARTYAEQSAGWSIRDTDTFRTGLTSIRVTATVDYSYDFGTFVDATAAINADFFEFNSSGGVTGFHDSFACGVSFGGIPSCSGGFDTSNITIGVIGTTYTLTGTAWRDIDVDVNMDHFMGFGFANQADTPTGGPAGAIFDLGQGNTLSYLVTANEGTVTASLIPEPGLATLLAFGLFAAAVARRRP